MQQLGELIQYILYVRLLSMQSGLHPEQLGLLCCSCASLTPFQCLSPSRWAGFQGQKIWPQHSSELINKWMSVCQSTDGLTSSKVYSERRVERKKHCLIIYVFWYISFHIIVGVWLHHSYLSPPPPPPPPPPHSLISQGHYRNRQYLNCLFFQHACTFEKVMEQILGMCS